MSTPTGNGAPLPDLSHPSGYEGNWWDQPQPPTAPEQPQLPPAPEPQHRITYSPFEALSATPVPPLEPAPTIPPNIVPARRRWFEKKSSSAATSAGAVGSVALRERTEIPRLVDELVIARKFMGRVALGSTARLQERKARKAANEQEGLSQLYSEANIRKMTDVRVIRDYGVSKKQAEKIAKINKKTNAAISAAPGNRQTKKRGSANVNTSNPISYGNPANWIRLSRRSSAIRRSYRGIENETAKFIAEGYSPEAARQQALSDHELRRTYARIGHTTDQNHGYDAVFNPHGELTNPGDRPKQTQLGKQNRTVRKALKRLEASPIKRDSVFYIQKQIRSADFAARTSNQQAARKREAIDKNRKATDERIERIQNRLPRGSKPIRRLKQRIYGQATNPRP